MGQRHILLLDPNDGNRRNLAFLLHLAGYQVTEMVDENETLNHLELCAGALTVDLLLICPDGAGFNLSELLGRLQQWQLACLIVSQHIGLIRPARIISGAPASCRRNEVIEALAGLWPATDNQCGSTPKPAKCPQELDHE
jgi:CheY-like chemotaxis protein